MAAGVSSSATSSSEVHWSGSSGASHAAQRPPPASMDVTGQWEKQPL